MRSLPTFTFINKLDRAGRAPLELLDEIEKSLKKEKLPLETDCRGSVAASGAPLLKATGICEKLSRRIRN